MDQISKLIQASNALDDLIAILGNSYDSLYSSSYNIEHLGYGIDALIFAKEKLAAQVKLLQESQTNSQSRLLQNIEE